VQTERVHARRIRRQQQAERLTALNVEFADFFALRVEDFQSEPLQSHAGAGLEVDRHLMVDALDRREMHDRVVGDPAEIFSAERFEFSPTGAECDVVRIGNNVGAGHCPDLIPRAFNFPCPPGGLAAARQ
jgi:hypothetical protein